jgi:hypothetical protein
VVKLELQFENKTCRYLRRNVWEAKDQEQTLEVKLPEGMPDIGSILAAWGQCVMRGKEWRSDGMNVSGGVMAWVLYAPADGAEPRWIEAWLPVQVKWSFADSVREGSIRACWLLKGVDARTLSARKMMVRANVSVLGEALEPSQEEISNAEQVPEDVQLLRRSYPVRLPVEAGGKTFVMDEEFSLPPSLPAPEKIVSCCFEPQVTEQKVLGGKAVFRGNGNFHMVYQGMDGQLHSHDQEISFSQFSDLDRDYDKDAEISTIMALSSLEPELQDGRVRLKCGMIAQYLINDAMMLELVEDAYSPDRSVDVQMRELRLPIVLDHVRETVRFDGVVPENASRIVDVSVCVEQPSVRRAGDLTELCCDGQFQVLFCDENGALQGQNARWSQTWELPASMDADILGMVQNISRPQFSNTSGQINLNGELLAAAKTVSQAAMPMVTGLKLGEATNPDPTRPSLILRRAGERSLWEIAKGTGSTVSAIRKANGLVDEPLDDRILLIPVS